MLKPHHTVTEMQDLLSEYSLLKEVDHPNVIKLIGACTDRRGPIYLIMEFAKYGSLRIYLRRSSEYFEGFRSRSRSSSNTSSSTTTSGFSSCSSGIEEEIPYIKQKDIISFAWQIAKGMAYLAEIKVRFVNLVRLFCTDVIAPVGPQRSCHS